MLSEPDASRSGKSGLVSSSTRRYLKLVIGSVHLPEGHKPAGEWELVHGERRVEILTTAKTANPSIHMRLRAEHPRERLRTNPLGKYPMHDLRCWSEKKWISIASSSRINGMSNSGATFIFSLACAANTIGVRGS